MNDESIHLIRRDLMDGGNAVFATSMCHVLEKLFFLDVQ